jgi:hypothetical protein
VSDRHEKDEVPLPVLLGTRKGFSYTEAADSATAIPLAAVQDALPDADLVVSCLGVSEYVITADMVRGPVTLLDLAIPRSIEPKAALPVFGLAALLGFDLLPRIRNWHDLNFYRPDAKVRYKHIDSLFDDSVIDWARIERHWKDLLRTGISIREGRLSSVTLLRRLGNHSKRNRIYKALRELGRVVRTVTLLRYLSEPELRVQITAITNRTEAFHGFATHLMIGGRLIGHNAPDYQERVVKFNELIANCAIYSTALDITDAANALAAEGHLVDPDWPPSAR